MYEEIAGFIEKEDYDTATELLIKALESSSYNDRLAVLAATINEHFGLEEEGYQHIIGGLRYNYTNYELYLMLGDYYVKYNADLAYLCYEQALYYCEKQAGREGDDYRYISDVLRTNQENSIVRPLYIVIVLKGDDNLTKRCVQSIEDTCPGNCYELAYVESNEHLNDIIRRNCSDYDIMILNNCAIAMPNTVFCLRFGLYQSDHTGIVGVVTNCEGSVQRADVEANDITGYTMFAAHNNIPHDNSYELRTCIEGTGLIIKGEVLEKVREISVDFGIGTMTEYQDMCLQVMKHGYRNLLCWNSFLYCEDQVFLLADTQGNRELQEKNRDLFIQRWGFQPDYYSMVREDIISLINETDQKINVLEVGCGTGATLGRIKYMNPEAVVKGIELQKEVADICSMNFDIVCGDIETMELAYEDDFFDYVIFGDVLEHLRDPWTVLKRLQRYVKKGGRVITSIPNLMNAEVIYNLLQGRFSYKDSGILDRTHLRFFTYQEIIKLFESTGYRIQTMLRRISGASNTDNYPDFYQRLLAIEGVAGREEFDTFQYLVVAEKDT